MNNHLGIKKQVVDLLGKVIFHSCKQNFAPFPNGSKFLYLHFAFLVNVNQGFA